MRSIQQLTVLLGLTLLAAVLPGPLAAQSEKSRTGRGLVALYDFQLESGPLVKDRSGVTPPLDLRIANPQVVRRTGGALEIRGSTTIRTEKPPVRLLNAIRQSGSITVEAWIRPARTDQEGPARIVSFSNSPNQRNFTLGQEFDAFDFRLRTSSTSSNGIPSISTVDGSLTAKLTHVVYTRQRAGRARLYINGTQAVEKTIAGNMSNWDKSHQLLLANELSGNRPWLGTYRLVAIYNRELAPQEVMQNYRAGAGAETMPASGNLATGARLFDEQVAGLLSNHCLECHDRASHKGGLDLSRESAAMAGGESGKAIQPGKAAESLLWEQVESDEMPKDRPALSIEQKKSLRTWIDAGATWTTRTIDPVLFTHDGPAETNWIRRLTLPEYIETVRSSMGVDIASEARQLLPADLRADGFSNTAYNLQVDLKHVEAYGKLAETVVGRMDVKAFAARFSKSRLLTDDSMRDLIARMGKWILRGPLEELEIVSYRGISTTVASAGGNFEEAVGFIITAMMQSPRFIYRVESQQGDGTDWPAGEY
ncbi:MAG: LamG-like jellyroll fold domain-containing protein, partial [Pirellulaceae bacterium]